jgi:hypothetical protein
MTTARGAARRRRVVEDRRHDLRRAPSGFCVEDAAHFISGYRVTVIVLEG